MPKIFKRLKSLVNRLGPGFITGAADDDPSGVTTYSIAGAQFGYKLNWLSLFLIPMMVAIQEMCGRIGLTSGMGLAGVIKKFYSRKVLLFAVFLLFVATPGSRFSPRSEVSAATSGSKCEHRNVHTGFT